ncbi:MAG: CoA-acylating methylmalonate-semialdehyde dehydrogenase [Halofilum sp. (in: g-proteobacteria)]|nr:CoA-acylating methylmalonate-semialdehyde dehydrogenase [Halofilum sp. (in: g-proteobacteria)]
MYNPATGEVAAELAYADADDTRAAIAAARAALPGWAATAPLARARVLFRFKALIEEHFEELAGLVCAEHGKVLADARGEVTRGMEVVEFACGIPHLLKGEHSENVGTAVDSWSVQQPLGVVAGITPFNFPAMVPMWMFPIALACGNTFVLKPSEKDPSCPLRLAELLTEAGLPDGVLNVVNGDREAVDALLTDDRVGALSFVGSTPVAEDDLPHAAAAHGKRVQALGGAKNHAIVLPDADLDNAASTLIGAAFGSAGERCMAISVAVCVGDATADRLVAKLGAAGRARSKVGPGTETRARHGPAGHARASRQGRRLHRPRRRGRAPSWWSTAASSTVPGHERRASSSGGCLFDRVTPEMSIYRDEIFGPVLCVVRVETFEEAIVLINAHQYGNGTCVFTRDGEAARRFADAIEVGMVGINVPLPVPVAFHSFGGWKRSLFGPMHIHGPEGVRFYTRMKTVTARWPTDVHAPAEFSMPTMK